MAADLEHFRYPNDPLDVSVLVPGHPRDIERLALRTDTGLWLYLSSLTTTTVRNRSVEGVGLEFNGWSPSGNSPADLERIMLCPQDSASVAVERGLLAEGNRIYINGRATRKLTRALATRDDRLETSGINGPTTSQGIVRTFSIF